MISSDSSMNDHASTFKNCTGYSPDDVKILAKAKLYPFLAGLFLYIVLQNEKSDVDITQLSNKERQPYIKFIGIDGHMHKESSDEKYVKALIAEYNEIRTLLYTDSPVPFYDFYVQNDLSRYIKGNYSSYEFVKYNNISFKELRRITPFAIISGTGGLGKSMMMRHFLLSSAREYNKTKIIPLFIRLKNYNETYKDVMDFIFDEISPLWPNFSISELGGYLDEGKMLVLFDGLDEINNTLSESFQNSVSKFISRYPNNQYILSSRPFSNFSAFSRFTIFNIAPFTKKQGLELIDKLHFREDLPEIKQKFREEFNKKLFKTHQGFSDNPLLLTIMMMTYEEFAEVPSKMHLFYQEAYTVLSKRHDASKGGYKRDLETGISVDYFADVFARFSALSYADQKYEFTRFDLELYFKALREKYRLDGKSVDDFIFDACNNLCLMYLDSDRYSFIHRSFQEYFCARYFASQKDKSLDMIGEMLDRNKLSKQSDNVLKMLYDMIPQKVDEYMILPYMDRLVKKCEGEDGYKTFYKELYGSVEFADGDMEFSISISSNSPIYQLITFIYGNSHDYINPLSIHSREYLPYTTYYVLEEEDNECVAEEDIPGSYIERYGYPSECGNVYTLDFDEVFADEDYYSEVIKDISDLDFPLYEEYKDFLDEYEQLRDEYSDKTGANLFDMLD